MNLTVGQIKKAASENKYFLLRFNSGHLMGVNSRMVKKALEKTPKKDDDESFYAGFIPANINEYINYKHPFINIYERQRHLKKYCSTTRVIP